MDSTVAFGLFGEPEFGEDGTDVGLDGLGRQEQVCADRLVAETLGHQGQHSAGPPAPVFPAKREAPTAPTMTPTHYEQQKVHQPAAT